jgi:hypothetical protein
MSRKTITKNCLVVISLAVFCLNFAACSPVSSGGGKNGGNNNNKNVSAGYEKPKTVGTISSGEITESSGIAASRCAENVFWTHNDSGDDAFLFALNAKGEKLGTWKVRNSKNTDWEDIAAFKNAAGECFLYIGDIGDNLRKRDFLVVFRVPEPAVSASAKTSNEKTPLFAESIEPIKFEYPDARHDAETLLAHPQTGELYVLTKRLRGAAGVYKLSKNYIPNKINRLEKIADFSVPAVPNGFLTGGDISPDGRRVVVCDYFSAYEIVLPEAAKNFDDIWREKPLIVELGEREQGEAVCYSADGAAIYATSENKNSPIIEVRRK